MYKTTTRIRPLITVLVFIVCFFVFEFCGRALMLHVAADYRRIDRDHNDYRPYTFVLDDAETTYIPWTIVGYATRYERFRITPLSSDPDDRPLSSYPEGSPESFGLSKPCAGHFSPPARVGFPFAFLDVPSVGCGEYQSPWRVSWLMFTLDAVVYLHFFCGGVLVCACISKRRTF